MQYHCSSDLINKIEVKSNIYPKVDVISLPDLKKENEKGNFIYKFSFELIPEVPMVELDKINLKRIEEEDIKEFINSIKIKCPNHQPSGGYHGQATDIEIHANEILRVKKKLNQIYEKHTTNSLKKLKE